MPQVEVAYARPDKQEIVPVQVSDGATAVEAVKLSGICAIFPEIDADSIDMGIFGKVIKIRRIMSCATETGWSCIARSRLTRSRRA